LKQTLKFVVPAVALLGLGLLAFWPSRGSHAGYPFARRISDSKSSPLWHVSPEVLERLMADDAVRLEQMTGRLDVAVRHAQEEKAVLGTDRIEDLDADARRRVREVWFTFLEPLLALDALKGRYEGWYGVDYTHNPGLHARAFGITFAALCAQVDAGQSLLELTASSRLARTLFDEAMPELGLPAGTFRALQAKLLRSRDYSYVPVGAEWFSDWINPHLHNGPTGERIAALVAARLTAANRWTTAKNAGAAVANKVDVIKSEAFSRWFPVQKEVATWFGDTRVAPEDRRLIGDAQLADMQKQLRPGDVIVERRNWYLSNIGLPGFWPHAELYTGTQDDIRAALDADPEVRARFGVFSEHLAKAHPEAWAAFGKRDEAGHPAVVMEAVSEGVVASSLVHACGADYVAAMRPRVPPVVVARALDRAMSLFGRPYDFNFDFATDDAIVCSELVVKAYEPPDAGAPGLRVPYVTVAGRRAIPPTELVRTFAAERDRSDRQLDFVYFLDGREGQKRAIVADAGALAASAERPKWDIVQP